MSDRFPTQIAIGGKISRNLLPRLLELIEEAWLQDEWGGPPLELRSERELLEHVDGEDGLLRLYSDEQAWGRFEDLEAFLAENAIQFDRRHDSDMGYDGELARWRQGWETVRVSATDCGGAIFVKAGDLAGVRDRVRSEDLSREEVLAELDRLLEDRDVEDLAALEVVD